MYFLSEPSSLQKCCYKKSKLMVSKFFISFFCRTEISFVFQTGQQEIAASD